MIDRLQLNGVATASIMLAALSAAPVTAAENISADIGVSENTHFVSYGLDVWGGGDDFFGSRSTTWIFGDFALKFNDWVTFNLAVWTDNNNNVPSGIGGHLQELDINPGFTFTFGKIATNITYNAWSYAGDVEESVDFSLGYDDTGLFMEGFGFHPKVVWHYRASGNGAQQVGSAVVVSIGPGFNLTESLSLAIPAGLAFFTTDDFQGGTEDGYGFSYLGGSLSYKLGMIPTQYGAWTLNAALTEYFTSRDAIPSNPARNFLYGSFGVTVAY